MERWDETGSLRLARAQAALRGQVPPFMVMDVVRAANEKTARGEHVIRMEVGQPATRAPAAAIARVKAALDIDPLGYTNALGIPELRGRIAASYMDRYGLDVAPERVIVTNGSSAGFIIAFLALFDHGARIGLPSPGYPCYRHIASLLGLEPVIMGTDAASRWMPTAAQIAGHADRDGIKGILIASPANPTGTMLTRSRMAEIAALCAQRGLWFVSDEIYHGLTYDTPADCALAFNDDAIVVNSFSKYYSMTGWRVGWMIVPERIVRVVERIAQNAYICAPAMSQLAALGAFDATSELEANRDVYARNRALLMAELPKAGFETIVPGDGAFYLYADVSALTDDSAAFTAQMLDDAGVAATSGLDFDDERGRHFVRFSYAGSTEDIAEGARRLQIWMPSRQT